MSEEQEEIEYAKSLGIVPKDITKVITVVPKAKTKVKTKAKK